MDEIIVGKNTSIVDLLRSSKFEAGFGCFAMFEPMVAYSLHIPYLRWGTYLPDPIVTAALQSPFEVSSAMPVMHFSPDMLHTWG